MDVRTGEIYTEEQVLEMNPADQAYMIPIRNFGPRIGRNDPCACGSNKKFKKCCWGKSTAYQAYKIPGMIPHES